jgi:hypothetical protein
MKHLARVTALLLAPLAALDAADAPHPRNSMDAVFVVAGAGLRLE